MDVSQEIEQRAQWSAPAWAACCALCSISCVPSTLVSVYPTRSMDLISRTQGQGTAVQALKDVQRKRVPIQSVQALWRIYRASLNVIPIPRLSSLEAEGKRRRKPKGRQGTERAAVC